MRYCFALIFFSLFFFLLNIQVAVSDSPKTSGNDLKPTSKTARPDPLWFLSIEPNENRPQVPEAHKQALWDLLTIAFSNAMWLENSGSPSAALLPFESFLNSTSSQPTHESWLTEYGLRLQGVPSSNRLVKWDGPVQIAIGWPQYGTGAPPKTSLSLAAVAERQVKETLAELDGTIPHTISFVSSDDPVERTKDFAKIRIVFVPNTGLLNHFKVRNFHPDVHTENWYEQINTLYVGAVPFTAQSKSQVDGFLLPKSDNTLGMAICRLSDDLPEVFIKTLISECIVRALGLPELSGDPDALLGPWNAAYDDTGKIPAIDGLASIGGPGTKKHFKPLDKTANVRSPLPSSHDKTMLKLLYCPAVTAGMSKSEVVLSLLNNDSCFNK